MMQYTLHDEADFQLSNIQHVVCFSAKWQFEIILYLYSSLNWIPSHEAKKNDYFDTNFFYTGISGDWYV